jgi:hypothetical protein
MVCTAGTCKCKSGKTLCNGSCVNLSKDANNCKMCGNQCMDPTPFCDMGTCVKGSQNGGGGD